MTQRSGVESFKKKKRKSLALWVCGYEAKRHGCTFIREWGVSWNLTIDRERFCEISSLSRLCKKRSFLELILTNKASLFAQFALICTENQLLLLPRQSLYSYILRTKGLVGSFVVGFSPVWKARPNLNSSLVVEAWSYEGFVFFFNLFYQRKTLSESPFYVNVFVFFEFTKISLHIYLFIFNLLITAFLHISFDSSVNHYVLYVKMQ